MANIKQNSDQTVKEKKLANLKSWKPGECGNPNGRPKGKSIGTIYQELLDIDMSSNPLTKSMAKQFPEIIKGRTTARMLAATATFRQILKGNIQALKEYNDRIEGKAKQQIEMSGEIATEHRLTPELLELAHKFDLEARKLEK